MMWLTFGANTLFTSIRPLFERAPFMLLCRRLRLLVSTSPLFSFSFTSWHLCHGMVDFYLVCPLVFAPTEFYPFRQHRCFRFHTLTHPHFLRHVPITLQSFGIIHLPRLARQYTVLTPSYITHSSLSYHSTYVLPYLHNESIFYLPFVNKLKLRHCKQRIPHHPNRASNHSRPPGASITGDDP